MDTTKLKDIVDHLENWIADCEILAAHLDPAFQPVPYAAPSGPGPSAEDSFSWIVDLLENFAENNARVLLKIDPTATPANPPPVAPVPAQDAILDLIRNWQLLFGNNLKSMLILYGETPGPPPGAPYPGSSTERQLCAQMTSWLEKIDAEFGPFSKSQNVGHVNPPVEKPASSTLDVLLVRAERLFHRIAQDYQQIANLLPYHLTHVKP